jgi:hypothetical protein
LGKSYAVPGVYVKELGLIAGVEYMTETGLVEHWLSKDGPDPYELLNAGID